MATKNETKLPDFSERWKLSDVVLVVEEERFHVHRVVLALSSPVFEKMFTSEFQEKEKNEIPLPDKKASEIKELLSLIYPGTGTETAVTAENCYFLFKLAHEYQMAAIVERCEDFMVDRLKAKPKEGVLSDLVFADTYKLEKLKLASVEQAHHLSLEELKNDEMYDRIQSENQKEIMEGIISRLQKQLKESSKSEERIKSIMAKKERCLRELSSMARFLVSHALQKGRYSYEAFDNIDTNIAVLRCDRDGCSECDRSYNRSSCTSLNQAGAYLEALKKSLESM